MTCSSQSRSVSQRTRFKDAPYLSAQIICISWRQGAFGNAFILREPSLPFAKDFIYLPHKWTLSAIVSPSDSCILVHYSVAILYSFSAETGERPRQLFGKEDQAHYFTTLLQYITCSKAFHCSSLSYIDM